MAKRHNQTCPVAEFLNIFGDAWTLMIIREAFFGTKRFSEMQRNTQIAKNLLSNRLSMLVDEGIFSRVDIGERGSRYEYKLTEKGRTLLPVFVAMTQWSNENIFKKGNEPLDLIERDSDKALEKIVPLSSDGDPLGWGDIIVRPGPGANDAARQRILGSEAGRE